MATPNSNLTLTTKNLILRPYLMSDAADIQKYAGDLDLSRSTLSIPHPYEDGVAESWIKSLEENRMVAFCIVSRTEGHMIGSISFPILDTIHNIAEIGYWIAKPFWGNGYAGEASEKMLEYGFEVLGLHNIEGRHFKENEASGKVILRIGMTYEGTLRQRKLKNGEYKDIKVYSMLRSEYFKLRNKLDTKS